MTTSRAIAGGVLAGGLHALALRPAFGWAIGWVALVPLLVVAARASPARVAGAALAYVAALLFLDVPPWLTPAVGRYFRLAPPRDALAVAVATGLVALACGAPLALALALRRAGGRPPGVLFPAALWAAWEPLRAWIPPSFPVAMLPTSQAEHLAVLQIASVTGIAGVTALLAAASAAVAGVVAAPSGRRLGALAAVAVVAGTAVAWGHARLGRLAPAPPPGAPRLLLVDGAATAAAESTLERYLAVTASHVEPRPDVVVWPESALPVDLERDAGAWTRLRAFVDAHETTVVTGAASSTVRDDGRPARVNSAHLFRPQHAMLSYHKRLLVPFAEAWPALLGDPPAGLETVAPGRALVVMEAGATRFGPLVCFEITDATSVRALARRGARFVVNLNNDAFWGVAPHLVWARVRAVESGLPVVRATNGGLAAVFDAGGRVTAAARSTGEPTVLTALIPAPVDTVYVRTGEVFLPVCFLVVLVGLAPVTAGPRGRSPRGCPPGAATGPR